MAITEKSDFTFKYSDLADEPVYASPTALKTDLDSRAVELRDYINNTLIAELEAVTDGASGLDKIGGTAISGLTGATGQALIESLKTYVDTLDVAGVKLTGDQTVAGVKTFSASPIVPVATTDTQAPQKLYVDTGDAANTADLETHKTSTDHDSRYYTETEVDATVLDLEGVGRTTETIKGNADNLTTNTSAIATNVTNIATNVTNITSLDNALLMMKRTINIGGLI